MAKIKTIPCDIYNKQIQVFIGSNEELLKYAKKYLKDDALLDIIEKYSEDDDVNASYYYRANGSGIVHLYKYPTNAEEISWVAHECLHATFHLLDYVNVKYEQNGANEAFTYLHDWLLYNALDKKGYKKI